MTTIPLARRLAGRSSHSMSVRSSLYSNAELNPAKILGARTCEQILLQYEVFDVTGEILVAKTSPVACPTGTRVLFHDQRMAKITTKNMCSAMADHLKGDIAISKEEWNRRELLRDVKFIGVAVTQSRKVQKFDRMRLRQRVITVVRVW